MDRIAQSTYTGSMELNRIMRVGSYTALFPLSLVHSTFMNKKLCVNKHWFVADYCTQKVFIHMHHIPPENALEHVLKILSIGLNHSQF